MRNFRRAIWGLIGLCGLPLLAVLVSTTLAAVLGCELSEAGPQACRVIGVDWGGLLSTLFTLGWMALVTLPLLALVIAVWGFVEGMVRWRQRRRARKAVTDRVEA